MTTLDDPNEEDPKITPPKQWATGVPAVTHAIQYSLEETSIRRTATNLFSINQAQSAGAADRTDGQVAWVGL
jgi:hypothetical protein